MVRLKVFRSVADKAFSTKFQFLMVRLKGYISQVRRYARQFQFLMVRLKVTYNSQNFNERHFNSLWFD